MLSALLILAGAALGGQNGLMIAFGMALVMNVGSYWFSDKIVLRMYNAQRGRAGSSALSDDGAAGAEGGPADAEGLRDSRHVAERVRDRPQSAARGGRRDRRHHAAALARASSRASSRTSWRT